MATLDVVESVCSIVSSIATVAAAILILLAYRSLRVQAHAWRIDWHRWILDLVDTPDLRRARRFVYQELLPATLRGDSLHAKEKWLDISHGEASERMDHLNLSDRAGRSFDQLGLLYRTRLVPENVIWDFFAGPILRCWAALAPFVREVRKARGQPGHFWEFENVARLVWLKAKGDQHIRTKEGFDVKLNGVLPSVMTHLEKTERFWSEQKWTAHREFKGGIPEE